MALEEGKSFRPGGFVSMGERSVTENIYRLDKGASESGFGIGRMRVKAREAKELGGGGDDEPGEKLGRKLGTELDNLH